MATDEQIYAGAAALGLVAGLRSMSAPALLSQVAPHESNENSKLRFLTGRGFVPASALLAAGEFVADKLPFIPSRTAAGPLTARVVSGALSGAALCSARKKSPWLGALFGGMGAAAAAFAGHRLRRAATERFSLPDPIVAVAEDAIVAASALLLVSRLKPQNEA